jgi:predicted AAA+ superfamily ATPase
LARGADSQSDASQSTQTAHTPWGELASSLAGKAGYERVRKSDESHTGPGAETLAELFGGEPCIILLDELSVYLRKARNLHGNAAGEQLSAFLTSLFKAVESSPRVSLVYTLAIGKEGKASDAYSAENQFIADKMAEAESISARKATLLNPTEDNETVQVLLRRLFGQPLPIVFTSRLPKSSGLSAKSC